MHNNFGRSSRAGTSRQRGRATSGNWRDRSEQENHHEPGEEETITRRRKFEPYSGMRYQRTHRIMGFRYLKELITNEDLEEIISQLSKEKGGFKELLKNTEISNDMSVLVVTLLAKICASAFETTKLHLLQLTLNSHFADCLIKFISTLVIQSEQEKKRNALFWDDPNGFFTNLLCICRVLYDLIPATSCHFLQKILKATKLYIPLIKDQHSVTSISDALIADMNTLLDIVDKMLAETSTSSENATDRYQDLEPPDDYRKINVYPSIVEVTTQDKPFLRPNKVKGTYKNVDHYLDVQFRLLREDFIAPLRTGICKYIANPKEKLDNIRIYKRIRFLQAEIINEQNCYRIQYTTKKVNRVQLENSKRFMFGSLLCFTGNNFKTIVFGKIAQRDIKDLEKGQLIVGFDTNIALPVDLYSREYLMVESAIYFEPYFHVLKVLKTITADNFPMERYILKVETDVRPPNYLLQIDPVFYKIENQEIFPLNWEDRKFYSLNESQQDAFKAALTQEFSIIQGPPGTGKTFLGLKVAQALLENKSAWYNRTPMLVICYTNHALDQFLEGLLPVTRDILRIGGRSKNENLNKYNIRNKRFGFSNENVAELRHDVKRCFRGVSEITDILKQIDMNNSVFMFNVFRGVIPEYKRSWFNSAKKENILKWLLGGGTEAIDDYPVQRYHMQQTSNVQNQDGPAHGNNENVQDNDDLEYDDIMDEFRDTTVRYSADPLVSLKSLNDRIRMLNYELDQLQAKPEWYPQDMFINEELEFELGAASRDFHYLNRRLLEKPQNAFLPNGLNLQNPHTMRPFIRWQLYWYWLSQYKQKLGEEREKRAAEFRYVYKRYDDMMNIENAQIMKTSLVVGLTTTGAARLQTSLQSLKSPIVIVEEAAEVLEAHIISSVTSHCQQLILIGDHQQLKPSTADFKVEKKFQLGISLFERMVINKIHCHTLNIQHRMRPEIACLVHPAIYPVLNNHESVLDRPPIKGVESNVYFINHQEREQVCGDDSKKNTHEANFLINLAKYLILNNYEPSSITILAAYLGQMFEMQRQKTMQPLLQGVRIAVLDNYQGEESDIILLSLVRNNAENAIGFLKIENRVCVALSRARNGLYVMGNMALLCENSDIWPKVRDCLARQDAIGTHLALKCQIHNHITRVKDSDDFMDVAEGGCKIMCQTQLACGHTCTRLCHVRDKDHLEYKCKENCNKPVCNNTEHLCKKLCHEVCGPCTYQVEHELSCGHKVTINCHIDPGLYKCPEPVRTPLPCGHEADKPCYMTPEDFTCPHPCDVQVQPCGHACTKLCHIQRDPDHLKYRCTKRCARPKIGCSLQEDSRHMCTRLCLEPCEECVENVRKERKCSHMSTVPCKDDVDTIECEKPCKKVLNCGHECRNKCDQPCGTCYVQVVKLVPGCNHEIKLRCSQEINRKFCKQKCPRLLPCGHKCLKKCFEECTKMCNTVVPCLISSPCGHLIKEIKCGTLKDAGNSAHLLKNCTEKCNVTLKCGHICSGTCGECHQGRIHKRCQEKCGASLICNHACDIPCRQACKPCNKQCEYKCEHSKCLKKCGDICTRCVEPCERKCQHQQCSRKCGDICNVQPCYKPCNRFLKCRHRCVGFCGDPCPILCRVCNREELTTIFLGNEDEEDAIYVMLNDCKHIFESSDLEAWLNLDADKVKPKECPKCKTVIRTTVRYNEFIKNSIADIINIKKQSNGTPRENDAERTSLLGEIETIQAKAENLLKGSKPLSDALAKLFQRLQVARTNNKNKQNYRQAINKMDLNAVKSKLQMVDYVIDVFGKPKHQILPTDKSICHISFILDAVMRDEDRITDQEIQDITPEIERLSRIVQLEQIQKSPYYQNVFSNSKEVESTVTLISELIDAPKRYSPDKDEELKRQIEILNKAVDSAVKITEVERRQIVSAIGLSKGHWFKCPNGHYYVIGECGGADQVSRCIECKAQVGGQDHRLLPGQSHASEIDNSQHPAWSEGANMMNYRL